MLEGILADIEIKYRPSDENDELLENIDVSMSHIESKESKNFLYEEAKTESLDRWNLEKPTNWTQVSNSATIYQ